MLVVKTLLLAGHWTMATATATAMATVQYLYKQEAALTCQVLRDAYPNATIFSYQSEYTTINEGT